MLRRPKRVQSGHPDNAVKPVGVARFGDRLGAADQTFVEWFGKLSSKHSIVASSATAAGFESRRCPFYVRNYWRSYPTGFPDDVLLVGPLV